MFLIDFFATLMWGSFFIVFFFYTGYLVILCYFNRNSRLNSKTLEYIYPTISFIVPVYNEEKIIAQKIQNVEGLIYPRDKIEVIFVDGHSTDRTSEIIMNEAQKSQKLVRLIKQDRREGYTRGMIEGISGSKGEIVVATDAASYHDPTALRHLVKHFKDPKIGAVTGKEIVHGHKTELGPQLEKSYRFFYDFMRKAETEMDSTPDSKGEILAVRREICDGLLKTLELSPNASFDSCVPYQAKLMGYRTIFDEEAQYHEYAPTSFADRMRQQVRRATVLIGAMFLFRGLFLKKKIGKFGLVIMPAHFVLNCVLPSIFISGLVSFAVLTVLDPIEVAILWIIIILVLAASRKSRSFLVSFIQSQFALVAALYRLARRRESLFIESIPSTRAQV
jgi:biofilm PGA synthesis N-glycosyltransferase PgaC